MLPDCAPRRYGNYKKINSMNDTSKLPNAPLIEVIFEIRWALEERPNLPEVLHNDPGYAVFADHFAGAAKKMGFPHGQSMSQISGPMGHSIAHRFYKGKDIPYPIFLIRSYKSGPGYLL
jgi:hypothetical protein